MRPVMICKSCGKEIEDGSKFCTYCGAAQVAMEAEAEETPAQQSVAQSTPEAPSYGMPAPGAPMPASAPMPAAAPVPSTAPAQSAYSGFQQPGSAPQVAPAAQPVPGAPVPAAPAFPSQPAPGASAQAPAQQPFGAPAQQPAQPSYSGYAAPVYQVQAPKKKSPLPIILIGVAAVAVIVIIFAVLNGSFKAFWTGAKTSKDLPEGYVAIVDDVNITVGIGELHYWSNDNTIYADIIIINRSNYPVWLIFDDNYLGSRYADRKVVWTDIYRTEPGETNKGRLWFDVLHNVNDMDTWKGTVIAIDDDTYDSPQGWTILKKYDFNIKYKHRR